MRKLQSWLFPALLMSSTGWAGEVVCGVYHHEFDSQYSDTLDTLQEGPQKYVLIETDNVKIPPEVELGKRYCVYGDLDAGLALDYSELTLTGASDFTPQD
jgi:hypothetical protein